MKNEVYNVTSLFFEAAAKYPDKIAIVFGSKEISYAEFEKQVKLTAAYLQNKGINKGDKVLLFVPMSIDLYRIVLALFYMGATAVFLDEWVSKKRMEECCLVAPCNAFIGTFKARVLGFFSKEIREIPIHLGTSFSDKIACGEINSETTSSDTALITFTTGTSGTPKAAKRTHGFLKAQFDALTDTIEPGANDIDMPVLPVVLLLNLGIGCTSVIAPFKASKPESIKPDKIWDEIIRNRVNRMVASPFFIKKVAAYALKNGVQASQLKKIFTGGAPVFPAEAELYTKAFPGCYIEIVYGSTEAEPISTIEAKELLAEKGNLLSKGLKVGFPYRNCEVKIIRISENAIVCNNENEFEQLLSTPGETGEIVVSGPHVLSEYYNNDQALKRNKIFVSNKCWHRTGDSGYIKNGELYLSGRCNTLIYQGQKLLAPFVYEGFFQNIEGVETGTILEIGQQVFAAIELKKGVVKNQVIAQIEQSGIAAGQIIFIPKIPRDPRHNSKIDYSRLMQVMKEKI